MQYLHIFVAWLYGLCFVILFVNVFIVVDMIGGCMLWVWWMSYSWRFLGCTLNGVMSGIWARSALWAFCYAIAHFPEELEGMSHFIVVRGGFLSDEPHVYCTNFQVSFVHKVGYAAPVIMWQMYGMGIHIWLQYSALLKVSLVQVLTDDYYFLSPLRTSYAYSSVHSVWGLWFLVLLIGIVIHGTWHVIWWQMFAIK